MLLEIRALHSLQRASAGGSEARVAPAERRVDFPLRRRAHDCLPSGLRALREPGRATGRVGVRGAAWGFPEGGARCGTEWHGATCFPSRGTQLVHGVHSTRRPRPRGWRAGQVAAVPPPAPVAASRATRPDPARPGGGQWPAYRAYVAAACRGARGAWHRGGTPARPGKAARPPKSFLFQRNIVTEEDKTTPTLLGIKNIHSP